MTAHVEEFLLGEGNVKTWGEGRGRLAFGNRSSRRETKQERKRKGGRDGGMEGGREEEEVGRALLKRKHSEYAQKVPLVAADENLPCQDSKGMPVQMPEY